MRVCVFLFDHGLFGERFWCSLIAALDDSSEPSGFHRVSD